MHIFARLLVTAVVVCWFGSWKSNADKSWQLCSELSATQNKILTIGGGWYLVKGGMRARNPLICIGGECSKFYLDVYVPVNDGEGNTAKKVVGNFSCPLKPSNPSQFVFLKIFARPQLVAKNFRILSSEGYANFIDQFSWNNQKELPLLSALVQSVWKGTTSGFDETFIQFYQRGGLSHILAVSGTHVMILYYLLNKFLSILFVVLPYQAKNKYLWMSRMLVLLSAGFILQVFSPGNAPVSRSLFFVITACILNLKRWKAGAVQIVCSGLALLLIFEPTLFLSESFWLSSMGAFFLSFRAQKKIGTTYVWAILLIPVLMAPVVACVFGQISLLSPLLSMVYTPIWDIALIPMGYLSPFIAWVGIAHPLLVFFEKILQLVSASQNLLYPFVEGSQLLTLRVDLIQCVLSTICLVLLAFIAMHFLEKTA